MELYYQVDNFYSDPNNLINLPFCRFNNLDCYSLKAHDGTP